MPDSGVVCSALELEPCSDADRPRGVKVSDLDSESPGPSKRSKSSESDDDFLPELKAKAGTALKLTEFPTKLYPDGSTPSEVTQHSLDSSYLFEQYLTCYKEYSSQFIFQYNFVD